MFQFHSIKNCFLRTPIHLRGIRPAALPLSHLWGRLHDKSSLGKAAKGFDFLGLHGYPIGMAVSDAALSRRDNVGALHASFQLIGSVPKFYLA